MEKFTIWGNEYLRRKTNGYHNLFYRGYGDEENPQFLLDLKNTFAYMDSKTINTLIKARQIVEKILIEDIPKIMDIEHWSDCICVCIPRAKANMRPVQLYFRDAVSRSCDFLDYVEDGAFVINRIKDTKTTHLVNSIISIENNGDMPYPGITEATCSIDSDKIKGKNVILIDDIYTRNCNIDEDCIQALYNVGAKKVVFYAIAYTKRRDNELF